MSSESLILVLNAGSTSLKYKLFNSRSASKLRRAQSSRSWPRGQTLKVLKKSNIGNLGHGGKDHADAFRKILRQIGDLTDIRAVGHRIVHGGQGFSHPTLIDDQALKDLAEFNHLAPLHNPYGLAVLESARIYLSDIPHIAVFDTGFFVDLPLKTKVYAIPLKYYEKHGIQRFGFHGISHQYVAEQAAQRLKKRLNKINLITCHLGGGCSIAAIEQGRAIDTSMGFTPLDGLVMMTRPGDIDPGLIFHLNQDLNLPEQEIYNLLNYESGIKGLFGSDNFLKLLRAVKKKNKRAKLAFEIFVYRIQKYISAYWGILNNVQGVVFTGAIGAGKPYTRQRICQGLKFLKKTKILVIPSDEELTIAQECLKFKQFFSPRI
ncbi:acetate/propionate family kinase [Patescibacteria group bacterium]|nr:acetate/propionate family kinase [Patescibacteria group bacterium]